MSVVVQVATTTMLADLDEALRTLLVRGFQHHGIDRVDVAFDAPDREWSGQLSAPTLNLFLYDLRESTEPKRRGIDERRTGEGAVQARPPLRLDCSYSISAWTNDVQDEHRLLSQALAILFAFPKLPEEVLPARLRDGSQRYPLHTKIGQPREGKADFWGAVGGQYKASLDYVVTLTVEPGAITQRGPEVRSHVVRVSDFDAAAGPGAGPAASAGSVNELQSLAGRVVDSAGDPVSGAWVAIEELGRFAVTDAAGRYRIERIATDGPTTIAARGQDGTTAETTVQPPTMPEDLILGGAPPKRGRRMRIEQG